MLGKIRKHIYEQRVYYFIFAGLIAIYLYTSSNISEEQRVKLFVFDLDETLGQFGELSVICGALEEYYSRKFSQNAYFQIFDKFPEYFRPFDYLHYIKQHKGEYDRVIIYTNNSGGWIWPTLIKDYINYKLGTNLIDQVIPINKIDGKVIEPRRTTFDKTWGDLVRCANIHQDMKILFVDNLYHPKMVHENVYYVHCLDYKASLPNAVIQNRLGANEEFLHLLSSAKRSNDYIPPTKDPKLFQHIQQFMKEPSSRLVRT